ncbi:hypothetical protein ACJJTC_001046 [Scirpophaga incertulas]
MKLENSITHENINQNLLKVNYAVRGPILDRAEQIERELAKGVSKPFERVIRANIGDCHALGQQPFTFIRQVMALVSCPTLLTSEEFPEDVKDKAREILDDCTSGSVGAYSPSLGLRCVRRRAAEYLAARDGVPAAADDVWLGAGASDLVKSVLSLFAGQVDGKPSAVMVPVPQYPLFSGTLAELGVHMAPYYLDEENHWAVCIQELERSWNAASKEHAVRALVIINPGNPTGQVLSRENIEKIIKFAHERRLLIMADEVYQENIISKPFHSFKKVTHELGAPYCDMELSSFVTASKGWAAECGARAAFVELRLPRAARAALLRVRALQQCPAVPGQAVLHCVVRAHPVRSSPTVLCARRCGPPRSGEPSHAQFAAELRSVRAVLRARAAAAHRVFSSLPGYCCNVIDGSMFAFPRVELPARAQRAARRAGLQPDELYCLRLLEDTGICVVPGSGFGQRPGTFHFRTTILHPPHEFRYMLRAIAAFHHSFLEQYRG